MPHQLALIPAAPRYWIAVASADHVARGIAGGFMQVCHGKRAPLARIRPGDGIIYYAPTQTFGTKTPLQAFVARGEILPGEPYQVAMTDDFHPWRRDVRFAADVRPLLPQLTFITDPQRWGYVFRFGLLSVPAADFARITRAMQA